MAELKNLGESGRKALVEAWSGFLPKYGDPPFQSSNGASMTNGSNTSGQMSHSSSASLSQHLVDEEEEDR